MRATRESLKCVSIGRMPRNCEVNVNSTRVPSVGASPARQGFLQHRRQPHPRPRQLLVRYRVGRVRSGARSFDADEDVRDFAGGLVVAIAAVERQVAQEREGVFGIDRRVAAVRMSSP